MKAQADDYHICGRDSDDGSVSNQSLSTGAQKTWGEPRRNRALSSNEGKSISYWLLQKQGGLRNKTLSQKDCYDLSCKLTGVSFIFMLRKVLLYVSSIS